MADFYEIASATITHEDGIVGTFSIKQYLASAPSSVSLELAREMFVSYGDVGTLRQGAALVPSEIQVRIYDDAAGTLVAALASADADEEFRVAYTESGSSPYEWYGRIALSSFRRPLFENIEDPAIALSFYCGLVRIPDTNFYSVDEGTDADFASFANIADRVLYDLLYPLDVYFMLAWHPVNWRTNGTPANGILPNELRFLPPASADEPSVFAALAEQFDARIFQDFRGRWRIQQRVTDGQSIALATQIFSESIAGAAATTPASPLAADTLSLTSEDWIGLPERAIALRAPRVDVLIEHDEDDSAPFQLVRDGALEEWFDSSGTASNTENLYWSVSGSAEREETIVRNGTYAARFPSGDSNQLQQKLALVSSDSDWRARVTFYAKGVGSTPNSKWRLKIVPFDTNADVHYSDSDGSWNTTNDYHGTALNVTTWTLHALTLDPFPIAGLLVLEIVGYTSGTYAVDDVSIVALTDDGNNVSSIDGRQSRYSESTGEELGGGQTVSFVFPFSEHQQTFNRIRVREDDVAINYWPVAEWTDENSTVYTLISDLLATKVLRRLGNDVEIISGTIDGIVMPGRTITFNSVEYLIASCKIDRVNSETFVTAVEMIDSL